MEAGKVRSMKEIREERGMSRKEVAEASGVNLRSLQDYEQGHKEIASAKAETVYRLSLALGCTMEELMGVDLLSAEIERERGEKQGHRLYAYSVEFLKIREQIKKQDIYSSKHHVHGRWEIGEDECILAFCFRGEIVRLPFRDIFSEKTFAWLVDVAEMRIDRYIDEILFQEKYDVGEVLWDE